MYNLDELMEAGIVHFTGFRHHPSDPRMAGQLLYRGTAKFQSSRQVPVYYYQSVVVSDPCEVDMKMQIAFMEIAKVMQLAERGFLYKWLSTRSFRWSGARPKYRRVSSVQWQRWLT